MNWAVLWLDGSLTEHDRFRPPSRRFALPRHRVIFIDREDVASEPGRVAETALIAPVRRPLSTSNRLTDTRRRLASTLEASQQVEHLEVQPDHGREQPPCGVPLHERRCAVCD